MLSGAVFYAFGAVAECSRCCVVDVDYANARMIVETPVRCTNQRQNQQFSIDQTGSVDFNEDMIIYFYSVGGLVLVVQMIHLYMTRRLPHFPNCYAIANIVLQQLT